MSDSHQQVLFPYMKLLRNMPFDPPVDSWERRLLGILCGVGERIIFDPKHANKTRQLLIDFNEGLPEAQAKANEFEFCEKLIEEILALNGAT
jgi:hypothetical protein